MNERPGSHESEMREADLKPEVRRYVENLKAQIRQRLADFGFEKSSELQAAITEGSPTFVLDTERRDELLKASDELSELITKYKEAKEKNVTPLIDINLEDYVNPEFLEKHRGAIFSMEIGGVEPREILADIAKKGIRVGKIAQRIIPSGPAFQKIESRGYEFIRLSLQDLGLAEEGLGGDRISFQMVKAEATKRGLLMCDERTAAHYRLLFPTQNEDETILFLPKAAVNGSYRVFYVGRDREGEFFNLDNVSKDSVVIKGDQFVFRLQNKTPV